MSFLASDFWKRVCFSQLSYSVVGALIFVLNTYCFVSSIRHNDPIENAPVLPVPDCAWAIISLPDKIIGIDYKVNDFSSKYYLVAEQQDD